MGVQGILLALGLLLLSFGFLLLIAFRKVPWWAGLLLILACLFMVLGFLYFSFLGYNS